MTPSEILRVTETALIAFLATQGDGGDCSVAHDYDHALELLQAKPTNYRVVLGYDGYAADDDNGMHGVVRGEFFAIIQTARGLHVRPGRHRHRTRGAIAPILQREAEISAWLRAARWTTGGGSGDAEYQHQVDPRGAVITSSRWLDDEALAQTVQIRLDWALWFGLDAEDPVAIETETANPS